MQRFIWCGWIGIWNIFLLDIFCLVLYLAWYVTHFYLEFVASSSVCFMWRTQQVQFPIHIQFLVFFWQFPELLLTYILKIFVTHSFQYFLKLYHTQFPVLSKIISRKFPVWFFCHVKFPVLSKIMLHKFPVWFFCHVKFPVLSKIILHKFPVWFFCHVKFPVLKLYRANFQCDSFVTYTFQY